MVAQVAALEPETAAKMAQPTTLVWSKRPGSRCIHGARPRNMSWLSRVRKRISPIQMKSGKAVSVQLEAEPESVRPIHTPLPRMRKSDAISSAVISRSLIAQGLFALHDRTAADDFEHQL